MVIQIATKICLFVHQPIANLPCKFHANPFGSFRAVANKQTNNDENMTSLAEVINSVIDRFCCYIWEQFRYG